MGAPTVGPGAAGRRAGGQTPPGAPLVRGRPEVRVVGLEIDPVRVTAASSAAAPPGLTFARGGFELAGLRPVVVRAMNVLRQYDIAEVGPAWAAMTAQLAPGGAV